MLQKILSLFFFLPFIFCYNESLAREGWYYSSAANCNPDRIKNWDVAEIVSIYPNVINITVCDNSIGGNLAVVGYNKDTNLIFVTVRRTVNFRNSIEDAIFFKEKYDKCDGCYVHTGFLQGFNFLKDQISSSFIQLKKEYPKARTLVSGHSLGAAISNFVLDDLFDKLGHIDYFYTYGCPRVGDEKWANYFDDKFKNVEKARLTHYKDVVPLLVPIFAGYYHTSGEVYYNHDSTNYTQCFDDRVRNKCANQYTLLEDLISLLKEDNHDNYMGYDKTIFQETCK